MFKWQPIETAPINTEILIYCDYVFKAIRYIKGIHGDNWYDPEIAEHIICKLNEATHWMPLPEPPEDS